MAAAVAVWRRGRASDEASVPGWLRSVDRATPARALRLGATLTAVNVKELAFAVGAGALIGGAGLSGRAGAGGGAAVRRLAGLGVAVPVLAMLFAGDGARARLGAVRDWLVRNQAIAMAAVLLVIGAMLVGSGIEALVAPQH